MAALAHSCQPGAQKVHRVKSQQVKGACPKELQSAQQYGEAVTWELTFTASPGEWGELCQEGALGCKQEPSTCCTMAATCLSLCPQWGSTGNRIGGQRLSWGCRGEQLWRSAKGGLLRSHMVVEDHVWRPIPSCTLYSKKPQMISIVLAFSRQVGEDESLMSVAEEWGASKMCRKDKWHAE